MRKLARSFLIRQKRKQLGWTLESLSYGICSPSYLHKIESGKILPSQQILSCLEKKLGLSSPVDCLDELIQFFDSLMEGKPDEHLVTQLLTYQNQYLVDECVVGYELFLVIQQIEPIESLSELESWVENEQQAQWLHFVKEVVGYQPVGNIVYELKAKANHFFESGQYLKAFSILEKALVLADDSATMGEIELELGLVASRIDLEEGLAHYQKAITLNPGLQDLAMYNMGSICLFWNDLQQAEHFLSQSSIPKAKDHLFVVYLLTEQKTKAKACLESCEPTYWAFYESWLEGNPDMVWLSQHKENSLHLLLVYEHLCVQNRQYKEAYLSKKARNWGV